MSIVGLPSKGLSNNAPSSVICVNLFNDTSWKPPLSYSKTISTAFTIQHLVRTRFRKTAHSKEIVLPALEPVCAAGLLENFDAWTQVQMIRVVEDEIDPQCLDLLGCQTFNSGLCSHWHKGR